MEGYTIQFQTMIDHLDRTGAWGPYFDAIPLGKEPTTVGRKPENRFLNRYPNVLPADATRVVLQKEPLDYINGNHVKVPEADRAYILTQGPVKSTAGHFWQMVLENEVKAIVMLTELIENSRTKCFGYYPEGLENGFENTLEFEDVDVKIQYLRTERHDNYVKRTFRVEQADTNTVREVLQFQYRAWPDFGVPDSPRAFLRFLQAVRDTGALEKECGPLLIHCSAGLGRTGTFCLTDLCLRKAEKGLPLDIKTELMYLRASRSELLQTQDQFRFVCRAILDGLKQITEGRLAFDKDEEEEDNSFESEGDNSPLQDDGENPNQGGEGDLEEEPVWLVKLLQGLGPPSNH